jgi:hypothetical protein
MQPWVIMLFCTCSTIEAWQPPQLIAATRRSPGLTKRMNSGDSWLRSVYDRTGLAEPGQASHSLGWTWAAAFVSASALPPWQSVQPSLTFGLRCMSPTPAWQVTQPWLLASAASADWPVRSGPSRSAGSGSGLAFSTGGSGSGTAAGRGCTVSDSDDAGACSDDAGGSSTANAASRRAGAAAITAIAVITAMATIALGCGRRMRA